MTMANWNLAQRQQRALQEINQILTYYGLVQDWHIETDRTESASGWFGLQVKPSLILPANPQWKPPMGEDGRVDPDFVEAVTGARPDYAPDVLPDDGTPAPEIIPMPASDDEPEEASA